MRVVTVQGVATTETLNKFIVVRCDDEGVEAVDMAQHRIVCLVEQSGKDLGVLVDEQRVLKSFSIFREPFVLDALLSCRPNFSVDVEHLK